MPSLENFILNDSDSSMISKSVKKPLRNDKESDLSSSVAKRKVTDSLSLSMDLKFKDSSLSLLLKSSALASSLVSISESVSTSNKK